MMNNVFFNRYLACTKEYPDIFEDGILPNGVLYEYISSTFLNGFINYVDIRKAFLLARYTPWNSSGHNDSDYIFEIEIQVPPGSKQWKEVKGTKEENFNKLITPDSQCHSHFKDFNDDVVILAKTRNGEEWVFFWYDCDCSDSCIGRFKTDDSDEEVVAKFVEQFSTYSDNGELSREIPLHYFSGWLSG